MPYTIRFSFDPGAIALCTPATSPTASKNGRRSLIKRLVGQHIERAPIILETGAIVTMTGSSQNDTEREKLRPVQLMAQHTESHARPNISGRDGETRPMRCVNAH